PSSNALKKADCIFSRGTSTAIYVLTAVRISETTTFTGDLFKLVRRSSIDLSFGSFAKYP
ncbi:hypothetical protein, partial [Undibacterium sp. 5I1]|uniref:hypothetical protein n=1 Tax=Undibacterium sp. 5I1 TaxID=3048590 RepID=UPI002B230F10